MVAFLAIVIIAAVLFAVGYPLWLKRSKAVYLLKGDRNEKGELSLRKESLYATIKELDFDYKTGKLSAEDYQELQNKYRERALALLREMEKGGLLGTIEDSLEEEIRAKRRLAAEKAEEGDTPAKREAAKVLFCPSCGKGCAVGDRFCPYCGKRLNASG